MKTITQISTLAIGASLALTPFISLADDGVSTGASVNASTSVDAGTAMHPGILGGLHMKGQGGNGAKVEARSNTEIDNRIAALQKLSTRISSAKHISSTDQSALLATLSSSITDMQTLKAKIDADSTTTMRADAKTIAPDYRVYALVMPQAAITAESDRILTITSDMTTVGTKLSTRISAASAAGVNVTAAQSAYSDYTAKVSDATTQANAAVSEIASLKVDNGDKTVFAANTSSLKDARAKLKVAESDLKSARADINVIVKATKGHGANAQATTTASTSS